MKHEIETLTARVGELYRIRFEYYTEHKYEIWDKVDNEKGTVYIFDGNKLIGEKPATVKQTEDAQYHYRVWKALGEEQDKVQARIKELKEKVIRYNQPT